ncbi:hypothetical protein NLU13_1317 [Sarocladium strictum]|uniref:Uncharacterized protein n=1 Tax=Sarocladium strictum TaxID=5046 RepID=A0AA39LC43_SARSR|nr:hypothetical protein NLU13_1317 [Sarocladium strictum]
MYQSSPRIHTHILYHQLSQPHPTVLPYLTFHPGTSFLFSPFTPPVLTMAASVRRLINHSRNRSQGLADSDPTSPLPLSSPSRKHKNAAHRTQLGLHALGKVGPTDSNSSGKAKILRISSPQLPDQATEDASASAMSGDITRSATVHSHRQNVTDATGRPSLHLGKQISSRRGKQRYPPLFMHQRPFKSVSPFSRSGKALQRSTSLRPGPPRPPRPDEAPRLSACRRPSLLKSISSDSFIQTRSSQRISLASSHPGSIIDGSQGELNSEEDNMLSEELRNFIIEADRAFQLGADPSLALPQKRHSIRQPDSPSPSRTESSTPRAVIPRPPIPRKSVGSGTSVRRKSSTSRPIKPSANDTGRIEGNSKNEAGANTSVTRRNSATALSHIKRVQKKSQPSATMPRKKVSWEARLEAKGGRWGLSEGMTEILTGQRFKKIEADEMLTPERWEELRAQREKERIAEAEEEARKEIGQNNSWIDIGLDTSEEELSPALSPSQSKSSSDSDRHLPRKPPLKDGQEARYEVGGEIPIIFQGSSYDDVMPPTRTGVLDSVNDALPPVPPPKSARRKLKSSLHNTGKTKDSDPSQMESLRLPGQALKSSTSSLYSTSSFSPRPATPLRRKLSASEDEGNIYLRSTPFTFTQPAFEHGAITFPKAEMGIRTFKMDDTLDWTAFQMAILGGADDVGDFVDEWEDARLSEELIEWFDGHGFEDWGRMVMEEETLCSDEEDTVLAPVSQPPKPNQYSIASMVSSSASSSTASFDSFGSQGGRLGNGSGATPPPLNIRRKQPPLPMLTAQCLPSNDGSLGSTRASIAQTKSPARGPAIVGGGGPGDVEEDEADAPMGFNLSKDLGEYLQWEAEYAYATDL